MQVLEVRWKPPSLKRLEELSDTHWAWLEHFYDDSHSVTVTAAAFGVSPSAVRYVKDSPAGQGYALTRVGSSRTGLNLLAGKMILDRLQQPGQTVPLDILIKIYSSTLPKDQPMGKADEILDFAERIANQLGMREEERTLLLDWVKEGNQ